MCLINDYFPLKIGFAIMLGKVLYDGWAIFGSKAISDGTSNKFLVMKSFSQMDHAELKIVWAITKRHRRLNIPLARLTGDHIEMPSVVKNSKVLASDTFPVYR